MIQAFLLSYLLNSLWQVPLVFAAAAVCARLVAPLGTRFVHRLWVIALGLEVLFPICQLGDVPRIGSIVQRLYMLFHPAAQFRSTIEVLYGPGTASATGWELPPSLKLSLMVAYALLTAYFAARFFARLARTSRLGRTAETVSHMGIQFSVSPAVRSPVTIGIRRSVLIVPPRFLDRVSPDDLQVVLAHEQAHMLRHDYAKNLLYQAISLPIAYHPAVALTRGRITETREMVCDELAAASLTHREAEYARTLLRLAGMLFHPGSAENLHAIGIFDAHIFERRIMNLTQSRPVPGPMRRFALSATCGLVLVATTASALALRVNPILTATPGAQQNGSQPQISASIMAAHSLLRRMPVYPAEAKLNKDIIDGSVVLDAIIGKDGKVQSLRVLKSLRPDYDASALDAVKDWVYKPYLLNGEPTEVETTITVTYSIDHSRK
jgi:TonB family protein